MARVRVRFEEGPDFVQSLARGLEAIRSLHDKGSLRAEILRGRTHGHPLTLQVLELGLCSIAAPVRDRQGRALAALNVGMPFDRGVRERALKEILPVLRDTARSLEEAIVAVAPRSRAEP
jgi:DNA-binding IclR family transcriptional regulator